MRRMFSQKQIENIAKAQAEAKKIFAHNCYLSISVNDLGDFELYFTIYSSSSEEIVGTDLYNGTYEGLVITALDDSSSSSALLQIKESSIDIYASDNGSSESSQDIVSFTDEVIEL